MLKLDRTPQPLPNPTSLSTQYSCCVSYLRCGADLDRGLSNSSSTKESKGHVKSASVSSPGPSAADNGAAADPLGPRYYILVDDRLFVLISCVFVFSPLHTHTSTSTKTLCVFQCADNPSVYCVRFAHNRVIAL